MKRVFHTAQAVLRIIRESDLLLKDLLRLRRENTASECVVLGNGPSLTHSLGYFEQAGFLTGKEVFVVNSFATTEYYELYRPKYYVLADPGFWKEQVSELVAGIREAIIESLVEKTKWPLVLLLPAAARKSSLIGQLNNKLIEIHFFNTTGVIKGYESLNYRLYQYNWASPAQQTVLISAIYAALNIGFQKVYVFGADHSWHENVFVGPDNQVYMKDPHFYEEADSKPRLIGGTIASFFSAGVMAFENHQLLNRYALYLNATIFNCSNHSYVDAYQRLSLHGGAGVTTGADASFTPGKA